MDVYSVREQYRIAEASLKERLEDIVPRVMREEGVDLWVVAAREYNEDPVFRALFPPSYPTARRLTIVAFAVDGARYALGMPDEELEGYYEQYWTGRDGETQMQALERLFRERDPDVIAVDASAGFSFADGLSEGVGRMLREGIDARWVERFRPADTLALKVMELRTPTERAVYPHVLDVAFSVLDAMYTPGVVKAGSTTTEDLVWFMRQRVRDLGLEYWFEPTMDLQRPGGSSPRMTGTIEPGDLLHCDFGIRYLGLCTDTQRLAYVARPGETALPADLARAMRVNDRFQDIVCERMVPGATGNEVLLASLDQARAEGIEAMLYSHPCGLYGHGPGPTIGLYSCQAPVPVQGDVALSADTSFALELNTGATCFGEPYVMYTEETVYLGEEGVSYLHPGRETIAFVAQ